MIEATTQTQTQNAIIAAHQARGEAVREIFGAIRGLFKTSKPTPCAPAALA